jgi:hypothetical protein
MGLFFYFPFSAKIALGTDYKHIPDKPNAKT